MKKFRLLSLVFALFAISAYATRVYVDPIDGKTNNDGSSWTAALKGFSAATKVTGVTEIWLKAGTYDGITTGNNFGATAGVKIYGGFAGTEENISERELLTGGKPWDFVNETVIDGNNATICITLPALTSDNETLFDGIVFANGSGEGGAAGLKAGNNNTKNLTLQNCQFRNITTTTGRGGAIYLSNAYSVRIIDCLFKDNIAEVTSGSAMGGGAINLIAKDANNKISGCEFYGNSSVKGGALFLSGSADYGTEVSNSVFIGNKAFGASNTGGVGGAFHSENAANKLYNLLVANNEGTSVVNLHAGSELYYATIVKNKGGINGGATTKIKNCISWGNVSIERSDSVATLTSTSPDVYNNAVYTSEDNGEIIVEETSVELTGTPAFVMPSTTPGLTGATESSDWALTSASPLLNRAVDVAGITTDLLGTYRAAGTSDLGAYEYSGGLGLKPAMTDNNEIYAAGKKIIVNTGNARVCVFDITGRLVRTSVSSPEITMEQAGYYIVKCGNKTAKVIVRE